MLAKPKRKVEVETLLNISSKLSMFDLVLRHEEEHTVDENVENLLNKLDRAYGHFNQHNLSFRPEYENGNNRYHYRTVPHWLSFINGEKQQSNIELSDWFEGEFRNQLPKVDGVAHS